ncbi:MAG: lipid-binding SYLF domain-containing protein [Candidatus Omnitrophica bacterium]|nr:lipid-binding SYLF domain-containing protein [Candidatus Omnitrophota bacterium]
MNCASRLVRLVVILSVVVFCIPGLAPAEGEGDEKVRECAEVLRESLEMPEEGIPRGILSNAYGVVIFPQLIKAGFMVGLRHGSGVLCVRRAEDLWSPPVFVYLSGGSFGWQAGVEAADIVLVLKSPSSVARMAEEKLTLGADASVAAGPVGRHAEVGADVLLQSEIFAYSRTKGLFAGAALEGAVLHHNDEANAVFYGLDPVSAEAIFGGEIKVVPESAQELMRLLEEYTE